jgi:hypothetical protein
MPSLLPPHLWQFLQAGNPIGKQQLRGVRHDNIGVQLPIIAGSSMGAGEVAKLCSCRYSGVHAMSSAVHAVCSRQPGNDAGLLCSIHGCLHHILHTGVRKQGPYVCVHRPSKLGTTARKHTCAVADELTLASCLYGLASM